MPFAPRQLTMTDAGAAVRSGREAIIAGETEIDLGSLERFDSAAVAALLDWRRLAAERGHSLHILHLPDGLASIARVYGVSHLLDG
jgi:phospholipid transport system transporter-binding protein